VVTVTNERSRKEPLPEEDGMKRKEQVLSLALQNKEEKRKWMCEASRKKERKGRFLPSGKKTVAAHKQGRNFGGRGERTCGGRKVCVKQIDAGKFT